MGDAGGLKAVGLVSAVTYLLGGLLFGIALAGLGYFLWREQHTPAARPVPTPVSPQLDPAGAK